MGLLHDGGPFCARLGYVRLTTWVSICVTKDAVQNTASFVFLFVFFPMHHMWLFVFRKTRKNDQGIGYIFTRIAPAVI